MILNAFSLSFSPAQRLFQNKLGQEAKGLEGATSGFECGHLWLVEIVFLTGFHWLMKKTQNKFLRTLGLAFHYLLVLLPVFSILGDASLIHSPRCLSQIQKQL